MTIGTAVGVESTSIAVDVVILGAGINGAADANALKDVWKTIAKACRDAKDKEAYDDFKGKVSVRGAEFKAAA